MFLENTNRLKKKETISTAMLYLMKRWLIARDTVEQTVLIVHNQSVMSTRCVHTRALHSLLNDYNDYQRGRLLHSHNLVGVRCCYIYIYNNGVN